jgi:hypothetical protein
MRKLLIGAVLFIALGGTALAWPYRSERVVGTVAHNRTGCTISVQNSSGWVSDGPPSAWHVERLEEPVTAGVAVYECGGVIGNRPAAIHLIAPDGRQLPEGCAAAGDNDWCYSSFPAAPSGTPQQYRLLIQMRAGEPVQTIHIDVSRRVTWRSGTIDALMSV